MPIIPCPWLECNIADWTIMLRILIYKHLQPCCADKMITLVLISPGEYTIFVKVFLFIHNAVLLFVIS